MQSYIFVYRTITCFATKSNTFVHHFYCTTDTKQRYEVNNLAQSQNYILFKLLEIYLYWMFYFLSAYATQCTKMRVRAHLPKQSGKLTCIALSCTRQIFLSGPDALIETSLVSPTGWLPEGS